MRKLAIVAATRANIFIIGCILSIALTCSAQTGDHPVPQAPFEIKERPAETTPVVTLKPPAASLKEVRRIYVEGFGDDVTSKQIQANVVAQLTSNGTFVVTEVKEKADAILKGSALEKTSQEAHSYSTGTAAGSAAGSHSGTVSGRISGGTGSISGESSGGFHSAAAAINDSYSSTETVNDARIAVRLVNQEGDIIWATAQESKGAKYKGASADVADKVVKQLLRDLEKQKELKLEKKDSTNQ
ncbi:MAG: hypothetical protein HYX26_00900 [Acidobacteriales bacterium]|nr:hypothetical protein [Terriglobales bacterium]